MATDSLDEIRKKNQAERVAAGACPRCFSFEKEWKGLVEYLIPFNMGRYVGKCELCGAPQYQEIL